MTFIQLLNAFSFYGLDVTVLAACTSVLMQFLKNGPLKNVQKKVLTFLPFALGTALFGAYAGVCNLSFAYVAEHFSDVAEHGFAVGALSTCFYVLYEQFIRTDGGLNAAERLVATMIEGYVAADKIGEVAKSVAGLFSRGAAGGGEEKTAETLLANAEEGVTEGDAKLLSKLIANTLAEISSIR